MKVYLDNNATTSVSEEVRQTIIKELDNFGNPSSLHSFGVKARSAIEKSRKNIAECINCLPDEIVFTSGGTESNNMAIQGYLRRYNSGGVITSSIEHHAVLNVAKNLSDSGFNIAVAGVDRTGRVKVEEIVEAVSDETLLLSIMLANNEVGAIQPVSEIVRLVRERNDNVRIHCDAVQGLGKIIVDVKKLNIDMLSISSHKIHGPKGVGALYIKKGIRIDPLCQGGHHEKGLRPGTENTPAIAGFGKAVELAGRDLEKIREKTGKLRDRLREKIMGSINNITLNSNCEESLSNTLNISFNNIEGEAIIMMLDMEGIAVSSGSACTSGSVEPSHVLTSMGVDPAFAQGSIRFSLSHYNTEEEIDYTVEKLIPVIKKLREMSPVK
ncbi:cysteine desulfurase family protein [Elusimicrobiota bacterium]